MKNTIINIKKYIYYIIDVILVVLLTLGIFYMFQTIVLNKKYVNIFDYTIFRVTTGSMKDEIDINDFIIVKITNQVEQNDVIVFEQDGGLIVHRIVTKQDGTIITKGDANNYNDEPIKQEQVIGKVISKISSEFLIKVIIVIVSLKIIIRLILEITKERNDNKSETK